LVIQFVNSDTKYKINLNSNSQINKSTPNAADQNGEAVELSIIMPCLNEAETLGACIDKAGKFLEMNDISGEIIIADNGSSDGSIEIAASKGARVVPIQEKGYGAALMGGINAAHGEYVIMGDSDDSYDFSDLMPFVKELRAGYDLVMGNRFQGGIKPGAMPFLHRYIGNPILSAIGRIFFHTPVGDFHCGLRGFNRDAILNLDLRTTGMEFASEMVVKSTINDLKIAEVSTVLYPDGRSRPPHLNTWRDGWRHLRFLLLYNPRWLFLYPGIAMMLIGGILGIWLLSSPRQVGSIVLDVNTLFYMALLFIIGFQFINFSLYTQIFAVSEGLLPENPNVSRFIKFATLEKGLLLGVLLVIAGLLSSILALAYWQMRSFGDLDPTQSLRLVIPGGTLLTIGFQTILSSFFLSILSLSRK